MPVNPNAAISITAFNWVPPFAQGQVRDLRVRWALEEAGLDYAERLLDPREPRPDAYHAEQPWGQVPVFREGELSLFESGAIVLHIGGRSEALLPCDAAGRTKATQWLIAALNSIEPSAMQLLTIDIFAAGEAWTVERRPQVAEFLDKRLARLADALGSRDWLEDRFTAGDLMMSTVLRIPPPDMLADHPKLTSYKSRCEARPAFARALEAQIAAFQCEPA
ncbi:MAG: glutathione S-transferase family protein [Sphingopyxis sp.]|nr:glutathione S-transferase family protein [Sphingopyxis sp.]